MEFIQFLENSFTKGTKFKIRKNENTSYPFIDMLNRTLV